MVLGNRSLYDLSLDDFLTLVENRIPEGPYIDYKETAYSGRPQDIREMLRDITALANAQGGYLVMGIREDGVGRPTGINPIPDLKIRVQAVRQACLDCIQERINGLEIVSYETGFNQGIIAVHVPASDQCPHMMIRDSHTDFFRRYDTDKRPMTIGEIRQAILGNPFYRAAIELELKSKWTPPVVTETDTAHSPYIQILTERSVECFIQRYILSSIKPQSLLIVSPFLSDLGGEVYRMSDIVGKAARDGTRIYVITRPPKEEYHKAGIAALKDSPIVEIRYNPDVHAKLYLCWCRDEEESFAMFGSGNLTPSGLRNNLELGMMIIAKGVGRSLVKDLYQWGSYDLRSKSERVKAIRIDKENDHGRLRHLVLPQ